MFKSEPKRGDVVVFRNPANTKIDYIKRLIGLPGDTIQMKRGRLYINGAMVEQTRKGEVMLPNDCGEIEAIARYEEVLPGGTTHTVLDDTAITDPNNSCELTQRIRTERVAFDPDNTKLYTVPAGHYFMMGDNRDHSQDSRYSPELGYGDAPGFVPFENFVGRADVIAFSLKGLSGRWFRAIQ